MKAPVIILGALCALLGYFAYSKSDSAARAAESATKEKEALTNQVTELRTRLALSDGTASQTKSNLQFHLEHRTADLLVLSNRLVQTHLLLQQARKEGRATSEELQTRVARLAVAESEIESLRRSVAAVAADQSLARELETVRGQLASVVAERDALRSQSGAAQVERQALLAKLLDPEFLRRQIELADEAADIRRRQAAQRAGASPDPRLPLELLPDGSVRYAAPAPAPAAAPATR